jgi:hypothetical protein
MTHHAERIRMDAPPQANAFCNQRRGTAPLRGQSLTGNRWQGVRQPRFGRIVHCPSEQAPIEAHSENPS